MVRWWFSLCCGVASLAFSNAALAQSRSETDDAVEPASENPDDRWYGWQTLSVDLVPVALFAATAAVQESEGTFWGTGALVFAVGGPTVHLAHGKPLTALGSLGLRVGLPLVGILAGAPFIRCNPAPDTGDSSGSCQGEAIIVGGLVGVGIASLLDATLLAFDEKNVPRPRRTVHQLELAPSFAVNREGGAIALSGAF